MLKRGECSFRGIPIPVSLESGDGDIRRGPEDRDQPFPDGGRRVQLDDKNPVRHPIIIITFVALHSLLIMRSARPVARETLAILFQNHVGKNSLIDAIQSRTRTNIRKNIRINPPWFDRGGFSVRDQRSLARRKICFKKNLT